MIQAYGDLETFSERDLKRYGTHAYAEVAEILLFPYAIEEEEPKCWDVTTGEPPPRDLVEALANPEVQWTFHNGGMFDLTILNATRDKYGLPHLPHSRIFDTMVCAMTLALPGSLETLCEIFGIDADKAKHKDGKRLIQLFCKPRPKGQKVRRATRETHPEDWQQFIEYAKADITSMREVKRKLPTWNYSGDEYAAWLLDQKINARGVAIDTELARCAVNAAAIEKGALAARASLLTAGEVSSATKRDKLIAHILEDYGIHFEDFTKDTLERALENPDIPDAVKELLRVRLQASATSVSKYGVLTRATSSDGRLRGLLQFSGAGRTRRWAGRLFQPQNLTRPTMRPKEIDFGIEVIKANDGNSCGLFYDNVIDVLSNAIRGAIVIPKGKKLVVADLSNIEGRAAAWLAGEDWKLDYFRGYDAGKIEFDNYVMAYAKSFGVSPAEVLDNKENGDGTMRQIGKVQELMLQYEGGVGAFVTGAATYRIDLDSMAEKALPAMPEWASLEAREFLAWLHKKKGNTYGLSDDVFVTCDGIKRLWRQSHAAIESYWPELKDAVTGAIKTPGEMFTARRVKVRMDGAWLRIRLPGGGFLCYPAARLEEDGSISYMGVNQYTRKWQRLKTYGGKLFENITQAVARDVLKCTMQPAEDAGYEIVLTVHDELITEAPDTEEFTVEELSTILSTNPPWAPDLPLAAAGFEAYRYRKG